VAVRILGSQMAHNVCCDSYHVYKVTYIYYTVVPILGGSSMWRVLACYFLGPLFTDWAPGYVRCGCVGSPVFLVFWWRRSLYRRTL